MPLTALLSVTDKTGLVDFARRLVQLNCHLVSTGGTANALRQAGLPVQDVSDFTGFPEMLDGRVKTLHPRIHGGLLGRRDLLSHQQQMQQHGIQPIDIVVVNLYPFEKMAERARSQAGIELSELIENIDIGGPSMLRSAAKNFGAVAVVTDPADYPAVADELEGHGAVSSELRFQLARKAFARTAAYDSAIASTLAAVGDGPPAQVHIAADTFPDPLSLHAPRARVLRYGENPHQRAALYLDPAHPGGIAHAQVLHGKELSYNNLVDLEAAWDLVSDLPAEVPAAAIIKHTNPAGCAQAASLTEAYQRALACDPVSAFGGIIACNRELDAAAATAMAELFVECIAAPAFSAEALAILERKKNLRLLQVPPTSTPPAASLRSISGGWLLQDADHQPFDQEGWKVVTTLAPDAEQTRAMAFAWRVCKHVKSNAIVFARGRDGFGETLGVGAGQMSRVDSVKLAATRARSALEGTVVASDAFFPFADGIEAAAAFGARALIQPGGSVRDDDTIAAANRLGLAMVFTGTRHFRH